VYEYLTKKEVKVNLPKGEPFDPILALVFMLPPQNFTLLPPSLANALDNPTCILKRPVDYYPRKF
jgi:5'-3' exonuclease